MAALGCAHTVTVETNPPGAMVSVDGKELGRAPVRFTEQPGSEAHLIEARLVGYSPARQTVERTELSFWPAAGVCAGSTVCAALGCGAGALLANPSALAGICGGCLIGFVNADLGCQTACAGCSLLSVSPGLWTAPGMTLGTVLGLGSLGGLWWLGVSPDLVRIEMEAVDTLLESGGELE